MIYSISLNDILNAALLTFAVFIFRNRKIFYEIYKDFIFAYNEEKYMKKYKNSGRVYAWASKKKLQVEDIEINRNDKVKFFVPCEDMFVEGIFIGIDKEGLFYVRLDDEIDRDSGEIAVYEARCLEKKHIVYVRPLQKNI